jgi:hypothetical protein
VENRYHLSKEAIENPLHPFRAQYQKVEESILNIEVMLPTFKNEPSSLGAALDRLEHIIIAFRGYKRTLPYHYKRPQGVIL